MINELVKKSVPKAASTMKQVSYYREGRYAVTIQTVDDLTTAERASMEEWFKKQVDLVQRSYGPPLFTEAEELAFTKALEIIDRRPLTLPEVGISAEFRESFPASCEIGRERSENYEMHIFFDNGLRVGCWSVYCDGSQKGEILSDEDSASVRRSCIKEKLPDA